MRRFIASLLLLACASSVQAGAWPREQGTGFASAAVRPSWSRDASAINLRYPQGNYRTIYIEYGVTDRLMLGLDLGRSVSGGTKTVGFLQIPLKSGGPGPAMSLQLGFGEISDTLVARPGFAIGWGIDDGWVSLDGIVEYQIEARQADLKLDATYGRNLRNNRSLILQLQTGKQEGDPYFARFAPSLVSPVGKHVKIETGGAVGLTGDNSIGLKFGIWSEF
ncbi:MAG: hypothetical protein N4A61_07140 [Pelagimonas sp.]|nr:hypothetical protein [Pelagimonas sp.]